MKKLFNLFILSASLTLSTQGQEIKTADAPLTAKDYMDRSINQQSGAYVCLGVGVLALGVCAVGNVNFDALYAIGGVGLAAGLGSIPLFLASGRNKHKARMMMSSQKTSYHMPSYGGTTVRGITLSIPLGK